MLDEGLVGSVLLVLRLLGGCWPPRHGGGVSHHALVEEPEQAGRLVDDSWKSCLLQPPRWVQHGAGGDPRGPAVGTCLSRGQAGPCRSAAGPGTRAVLAAAGARAVTAAWGLLQQPRDPQGEKVPVNTAWPSGDRAWVGEILGCRFFPVAQGMAWGEHPEPCSAMLSPLPPLSFRLCSHRPGGVVGTAISGQN